MTDRERLLSAFERLCSLMDELRVRCPWDQKQTMESLRHLTIEEVYELGDAILNKDMNGVKKELGDLLLHIVFYSKIAEEQNAFNLADVIHEECEKLIHRHPHIYGNVKVSDAQDVSRNWEQLKLKESQQATVLGGVPTSLPALIKAMRIQEKARSAGFDWEKAAQVWDKVLEELQEFKKECETGNAERMNAEFGDLLFALVNYARFLNINPEEALERTNLKFIERFNYMEQRSRAEGKPLQQMSLEQMDKYWNEAKDKT
jgi:XTP/dITP diphosphohydrolase